MIFVDLVFGAEVVGVGSGPVPLQRGAHVVISHGSHSSRRVPQPCTLRKLTPERVFLQQLAGLLGRLEGGNVAARYHL